MSITQKILQATALILIAALVIIAAATSSARAKEKCNREWEKKSVQAADKNNSTVEVADVDMQFNFFSIAI